MADQRPIGVFDSGLGGLTAVRELTKALPGERIVYFGDTGRVPYGSRSYDTIEKYALQDARFLLKQGVKLILAACGTVSAVVPSLGALLPVPFIEVVTPAAEAAVRATKNGRIGVIGTSATVNSGAYARTIRALRPDAAVLSQECPMFVPLVEAGWIARDDGVTIETARRYLAPLREGGVDTLILGCTHYPVIAPIIGSVMGEEVSLINTGKAAALAAAACLRGRELCRAQADGGGVRYFVSDRPQSFSKVAAILMGEDLEGRVELAQVGESNR